MRCAPACTTRERSHAVSTRHQPAITVRIKPTRCLAKNRSGDRRHPETLSQARHIHRPQDARALSTGKGHREEINRPKVIIVKFKHADTPLGSRDGAPAGTFLSLARIAVPQTGGAFFLFRHSKRARAHGARIPADGRLAGAAGAGRPTVTDVSSIHACRMPDPTSALER